MNKAKWLLLLLTLVACESAKEREAKRLAMLKQCLSEVLPYTRTSADTVTAVVGCRHEYTLAGIKRSADNAAAAATAAIGVSASRGLR